MELTNNESQKNAIDNLKCALAFREQVRNDKSGDAVATGALTDAINWIEEAARELIIALEK